MEKPYEFELIPIGIYDGIDIDSTIVLDDNYVVYIQIPNPEYNCEVILD